MDIHKVWQDALVIIEEYVSQVVFDAHFTTTVPVSFTNNTLTLIVQKNFSVSTLNTRYIGQISQAVRQASGNNDIDVNIVSSDDINSTSTQVKQTNFNYEKTNLRPKYIFDTFVKGKCNELAYSASLAVSESPGTTGYNPLFLYGGVGLGKTHLVHSIGNRALDITPDLKVVYVSSETFTNELVAAIRENTTQQFKSKYRNVDILIIDDVQFMEGKESTQEEMFHTFNDLYSANKQIILTSDLPPKDLTGLESRLTSRFAAGLITDVNIPDYETRVAILEKKLDNEKIEIPQNVKEFITRNIVSNIRDLEGALNKIMAYANLTKTTLSLDLAKDALKDQLVNTDKPDISIAYIQQVVAAHFKLSPEDLNSRKRTRSVVFPRQIAMYLCRKLMDISLPDVGKHFGGRDHSTVIHSCEKISDELEMDSKLGILLEDLEQQIKGETN